MKIVFIGHFGRASDIHRNASSAAGNQVQAQILQELSSQCGGESVVCYSMIPESFWPRGPLILKSSFNNGVMFIGYMNLPILKHIIFSIRFFWQLFKFRPNLCLQYNSYLFENASLLLFRFFVQTCALAVIIQDVHVGGLTRLFSKQSLRSLFGYISLYLAGKFDIVVPISSAIISDFHFKESKCFVFQGGITQFAIEVMSGQDILPLDIGVFAGGLEPHNGVDLLVDQWVASGIKQQLHVFGRGSLSRHIEQVALTSDRIIFHGFQSEDVILVWQKKARWNFCLRYSIGLNQKYFFPSKFFNILCAPGAVVVNDFYGLPETLRDQLCIVKDDLSDLADRLQSTTNAFNTNCINFRREIVRTKHSWCACINQILSSLK
jgi:glycosyltransferase involved in cell wall biosynthesis